jgi:predicted nucleic acid-binding protein
LSLADAFQISAALTIGCEAFITNDFALKRVTDLKILLLDELLNNQIMEE